MLASVLRIDGVRSRMKAERGKSYGTAALPKQIWNERSAISHSSLTPGPVYWREWGEGRGGGLLLACVPCGVRCDSERSLFCLLINTGSDLV